MTYLDYMNKFNYTFGNNSVEVLDIFKRIAFSKETMNDPSNYSIMQTATKEKLDVLAFQKYNDSNLYHILGLFNEIYDHTFLPQAGEDRTREENNFRNSKSLFFPDLFENKPVYGDLIIRVNLDVDDPNTDELEYELDTSQYAYVEDYDDFLRYVKTSSFSGLESGTLVQIFRPTESGNWNPISEILEIARSVDYGTIPAKFFSSNRTEVTAYREVGGGAQRVFYDGQYTDMNILTFSQAINGNFNPDAIGERVISCYADGIDSSDFCGFGGDAVRGNIIGHNPAEKYFTVIPLEGFDMNNHINNIITIGLGIDLCVTSSTEGDAVRITNVSDVEGDIANPLVNYLSPVSLLGRFISGSSMEPFSFRTLQSQYEIDQREKSILKIPPNSVVKNIDGEIKRLLKSGRSNEQSTIEGIRVVGGNVSETINGY